MTGFAADEIVADLRIAQNRMFSAVALAVDEAERQGKILELLANDDKVTQLYELVRQQVLALLAVPEDKCSMWYF